MFESSLEKEKIRSTDEVAQFLLNGGAIEQAIGVFEASLKLKLPKTEEIIIRR